MHFGATLRLLRVDAGLSLRELAARVGVSSAYLSRVENGHDPPPTPDRLLAIADALSLARPVLVELARQTGPAVSGYVQRVPAAGSLFLEIARRDLREAELARIRAFIEAEFPEPRPGRRKAQLAGLLSPAHTVLQLVCTDLEDLVTVAASRLSSLMDGRLVVRAVLAREREASSCLGAGLCAPHAVIEGAPDAAVLLTLARSLALPTPDRVPVQVAVVLVSGSGGAAHLDRLARVARLASEEVVAELAAARTAEQALAIVVRLESLW